MLRAERLCSAHDLNFPTAAESAKDLTCINLQVVSDLSTFRNSFTCSRNGISKINTYTNAQTMLPLEDETTTLEHLCSPFHKQYLLPYKYLL